jgi:hypothetical protein
MNQGIFQFKLQPQNAMNSKTNFVKNLTFSCLPRITNISWTYMNNLIFVSVDYSDDLEGR